MKYDICVLGLGYIGLPTASIFATKGKTVLGVDVVARVVETINAGKIHIEEPDLDILVRAAVGSGNLRAATQPEPAMTYIIAVPTPFHKSADESRKPDLSFVEQATRSLAKVVPPGALVILESTSPVGTTEKVRDWMLKELVSNDRIAGGLTPAAAQVAKELYRTFCSGEIFLTDARTAEMAKLTENSFRDVNIAFANELSLICDKLKIDVWELIRLANRHPRVKILQPGPGVGGHCIAVDPWFIVDAAPEQARLIRTAREVNDSKPEWVITQILQAASSLSNPVIACLGLAFKADVDDLRESPSVEIVEQLAHRADGDILAVEPHVKALPAILAAHKNIKLTDLTSALAAANIVVLLVNHQAFGGIERTKLEGKVVIDTRGFWK